MTAPRPLPGPALPLGPAAAPPPQAAGPSPTTAALGASDHETSAQSSNKSVLPVQEAAQAGGQDTAAPGRADPGAATRSARGRSVVRRGKEAERAIVRWARVHGYPHAERVIRTGYRTAARQSADTGDVTLCPAVIVQAKTYTDAGRMERAVPQWMADTEAQRVAAGAEYALLVVRRNGCADVGDWWCWLPGHTFTMLTAPGATRPGAGLDVPGAPNPPVRITLAAASALLRWAGWGDGA
jgi:hypothetical protein